MDECKPLGRGKARLTVIARSVDATVLQDITLSASAGAPLAVMPSGAAAAGLEGCVVYTSLAVLQCRPALGSVVRRDKTTVCRCVRRCVMFGDLITCW